MIRAWLERWRQRRRIERHLKRYGCITFCPTCKAPQFGEAETVDEEVYAYTCGCGQRAVFDFKTYPVPVLVAGR